MPDRDRGAEEALRARISAVLEEIAFSPAEETKVSERMKAMEMLVRLWGLEKETPGAGGVEGELSKLRELLEQRRARRESP